MKYLLVIVLFFSGFASAGSFYVGGHTVHIHTSYENTNNNNKVIMASADSGFMAGTLVNSYHRRGFMAGWTYKINKSVRIGALLATGYWNRDFTPLPDNDNPIIVPFPYLSVDVIRINNFAVTTNLVAGIVVNTGITFSF